MSRAPRPSWTHLPNVEDPPATVLDGLCRRFPKIDRQVWITRFERGLVIDSEETPFPLDAPYAPHLRVGYFREIAEEPAPLTEARIVSVDEHLVVADKPPFLPVIPGGRFVRRCLLYQVEEKLGIRGLAPIHRLDRATSGLVLFARREEERGAYCGLFAKGEVERIYEAFAPVRDLPEGRVFEVASRLVKGTPFFRMREVEGEPNAFTRIELLDVQDGIGRFRLSPRTGKKHQLRLHMLSLGTPILGDDFYPELLPEGSDDPDRPLKLRAVKLTFQDPINSEKRVFDLTASAHALTA